jgi:hypothetical protein
MEYSREKNVFKPAKVAKLAKLGHFRAKKKT